MSSSTRRMRFSCGSTYMTNLALCISLCTRASSLLLLGVQHPQLKYRLPVTVPVYAKVARHVQYRASTVYQPLPIPSYCSCIPKRRAGDRHVSKQIVHKYVVSMRKGERNVKGMYVCAVLTGGQPVGVDNLNCRGAPSPCLADLEHV